MTVPTWTKVVNSRALMVVRNVLFPFQNLLCASETHVKSLKKDGANLDQSSRFKGADDSKKMKTLIENLFCASETYYKGFENGRCQLGPT